MIGADHKKEVFDRKAITSYIASLNCSGRMEERWPLSVPLKMFCQIFSLSKQIATPIFWMVSDTLWFPPW